MSKPIEYAIELPLLLLSLDVRIDGRACAIELCNGEQVDLVRRYVHQVRE
jgi:hypothetical protein